MNSEPAQSLYGEEDGLLTRCSFSGAGMGITAALSAGVMGVVSFTSMASRGAVLLVSTTSGST